MTLSPLARNRLEMALRNNGYHNTSEVTGGWLVAEATFAPGRCWVAYHDGDRLTAVVATSEAHVGRALVEEGMTVDAEALVPTGAAMAFVIALEALPGTIRRLFELSRSLPSAPLDRFVTRIRELPNSTEAERLVIQRIGQDVFREALVDLWAGRCAVTGLDQPELLRASHIKPWTDCDTDAERLDPMNGLLLSAHWDLAFDAGLVSFLDDGHALVSKQLTVSAMSLLVTTPVAPRIGALRPAHSSYLTYHRTHIWRDR
jgi:hypothetical protein